MTSGEFHIQNYELITSWKATDHAHGIGKDYFDYIDYSDVPLDMYMF
jgi:hypothetical protein